MPEEKKKKGYGGEKRATRPKQLTSSLMMKRKKERGPKLKTKSVQTLEEKTLGDKTIVRKMTPTPGKKKSVGDKLKKVASNAKAKDAFSGVLSPEKVEERTSKKKRKLDARTAKNESKVKKILTRKQKQAARRGQTAHIENLEKAKGTVGND